MGLSLAYAQDRLVGTLRLVQCSRVRHVASLIRQRLFLQNTLTFGRILITGTYSTEAVEQLN